LILILLCHEEKKMIISTTQTEKSPDRQVTSPCSIPSTMLLSLAIAPFLGSIFAGRSAMQGIITIGEGLEEIFRGDRLPILHPTEQPSPIKP
jgi:hypothetical protein